MESRAKGWPRPENPEDADGFIRYRTINVKNFSAANEKRQTSATSQYLSSAAAAIAIVARARANETQIGKCY
jgi:hypothetical protein